MSKARNLIAALLAVTGGVALAQNLATPGTADTRFDPFRPEAWLNAPRFASPSTQPGSSIDSIEDNSAGTVAPPGRPIIRDPLRPPTRSPFRP